MTSYSARDTRHYSGPPPATCYWQVPAYPDLAEIGPERAEGIILFVHGQRRHRAPGWTRQPPPVFGNRFAGRGWDVVKVQRNALCEGRWSRTGYFHIDDLVARIEAARKAGYRRIIAAGQSTGAAVVLGASERSPHLHGVIAFAVSHGRGRCRRAFRPDHIEVQESRISHAIRSAQAPRLVLLLAEGDHCVGHSFTPAINAAFAENPERAFIYLDETSAVPGHAAAKTVRFDKRYGACIHDLMTREPISPGRRTCP